MPDALHTISTGLTLQKKQVANIASNLSNAETPGYKKTIFSIADLPYQVIPGSVDGSEDTTASSTGIQIGRGVQLVKTSKTFSQQGDFKPTDRDLDVAIEGKGFLEIEMPDGTTGYTRNGRLGLNQNGEVVTSQGLRLSDGLTIPEDATKITILQDGTVRVRIAGNALDTDIGRIQLATFRNDEGLEALGGNLYQETTASGTPTLGNPGENGVGSLRQGGYEGSTVNTTDQLIQLVEAQENYQVMSKVIEAVKELGDVESQRL